MDKALINIDVSMSNDVYQAADGVSKSQLDLVHKAPALLEWRNNAPSDPEKLETFNMGHAVHCSILEPDRYKKEYIAAPKVDRRTKAGKEEYSGFLKASEGKTVLTAEEYAKVGFIRDSALAHPDFRKMYESGFIAEQSIFWKDQGTGLLCKCRPDFTLKSHPVAVDIKTTGDIDRFDKSVAEYRYHVQDAHYSDGIKLYYGEKPDFLFLAVSTTISGGRYPVRLFTLSDDDKAQGMRERNADLETIFQCQTTGEWTGLETVYLPRWARDQFNAAEV